jgi:hypothetical protein
LEEKLRTLSDMSISAIINRKFDEELKRFNNPDAPKTRKLFWITSASRRRGGDAEGRTLETLAPLSGWHFWDEPAARSLI